MKDYKRLTKRDEFGNTDIIGIDSERLAGNLDFNELNELTFALNKFADLEDKIERGEIDYVANSKTRQTITDLLIEFDEMGFAPTTVCPDGEKYAIDWRERVRKEFTRLTEENGNLKVEHEVAQRDVENLTRTLEEANDEIKALEAENTQLKQTLSKMETVEKELRERLEKVVKFPCEITGNLSFTKTKGKKFTYMYEVAKQKIQTTLCIENDHFEIINDDVCFYFNRDDNHEAELKGVRE